jgi:preprotein translocase subunit SecA
MRIFGGEKISKLMDLIRADEEMPIESGMVSRSIEGAQKRVEAHHFDMRKHVLQYDDVLNTQREVIYRERRRILERADLKKNMTEMMEEHIDIVLGTYVDPEAQPEAWEESAIPDTLNKLQSDIPMLNDLKAPELFGLSYDDLRGKIQEAAKLAYEVREEHIGTETMRELERQILLRTIDGKWIDYLHNIDILREGIHLRGYGQRDPLQEYKREAFDMFNQLLRSIQEESIQLLFHAQPMQQPDELPDEFLRQLQEHMDGMQSAIDGSQNMPFEDSPFGAPSLHVTHTTMDNLEYIKHLGEIVPDAAEEELKVETVDYLKHLGEIQPGAAQQDGSLRSDASAQPASGNGTDTVSSDGAKDNGTAKVAASDTNASAENSGNGDGAPSAQASDKANGGSATGKKTKKKKEGKAPEQTPKG